MRLLEKKLSEIGSQEINSLVVELEHATSVTLEPNMTLLVFLTQCVYPAGSEKRIKIAKNDIIPGGILSREISKLQGTLVYQICDELAAMHNQSVELRLNSVLRVFLNENLPNYSRKPKAYEFHPRDVQRLLN